MNATEHRAEAERLHGVARLFQAGGFNDPQRRVWWVTMAHQKRIEARWHERRSIALFGTRTFNPPISVSLCEVITAGIGGQGYTGGRGGNLHEYEHAGRKVK